MLVSFPKGVSIQWVSQAWLMRPAHKPFFASGLAVSNQTNYACTYIYNHSAVCPLRSLRASSFNSTTYNSVPLGVTAPRLIEIHTQTAWSSPGVTVISIRPAAGRAEAEYQLYLGRIRERR